MFENLLSKFTMPFKFALNIFLLAIILCFAKPVGAQVIDYKTRIKVNEKSKTTIRRLLVQINSKDENWVSKIRIGHSPQQEFTLLEAKIIDARGNEIRKLKKKEVSTTSDRSYGTFYQDDLIESFDLFWNEYPYRIDYSYKIESKEFISIEDWYPLYYKNVTSLGSSLELEIPTEYEVFIHADDQLSANETLLEDKKVFKWNYGRFDYIKSEIYSPPINELIPQVLIMPKVFTYGVDGSSESWDSFGSWLYRLNEGTNYLTSSERLIIDRLLENKNGTESIIQTLYQYLQDKTQYVNVAIDVGGMKSYPASYVCENKYGDCKALTTYMKAMLAYAGIESNYTIVNAGSRINRINKDFPSQQFNHVILSVPLENDTIWLENTSNSLPYNYLGTFTQDRNVLMINKDESVLGRTPKLEVNHVEENREINFSSDEGDGWVVDIFSSLGGRAFENYQHYLTRENSTEQEKKVIREVKIDGFQLKEWEIVSHDSDRTKINVSVSGDCKSPFREIGDLKVINPHQIQIPVFEEPRKRKFSVRISYPVNKRDSLIYTFSHLENYEVQLPESILIDSRFGTYHASYEIIDSNIHVKEGFQLNSGDYTLEEYPDFYTFLDSIKNYKKTSAIILK